MAKKIDWTKPLVYVGNLKAVYVGKTTDAYYPHIVAIEWAPDKVAVATFDEYGKHCEGGLAKLSNAPEPEELQNGLWANIIQSQDGNLYLDLSVYRTRADAERAASPNHFKTIRLSTDGVDQ